MPSKCHIFVKPVFREFATQEQARSSESVLVGTLVSSCNHCVDRRTTVSRPAHATLRRVFFLILLSVFLEPMCFKEDNYGCRATGAGISIFESFHGGAESELWKQQEDQDDIGTQCHWWFDSGGRCYSCASREAPNRSTRTRPPQHYGGRTPRVVSFRSRTTAV